MRKMNVIRSRKHEIVTETINKVALSANDDERVTMEDGIQTYAHGYYKLRFNQKNMNPENIPFNTLIVGPTNSGKTKYLGRSSER